jgi:hypothetical protein
MFCRVKFNQRRKFVFMSSLSQQWRLLDNSSLSKPDFHYFGQPFVFENIQGSFAVISEALPLSAEIESSASRSDIGARLATEAAEFAFIELLDKKLNFAEMFFSLFSKQWQATVLLHTIENPIKNNKTNHTQEKILENYDPSIALFYQFDKQLILLQLGYTQIALLNRRYHCEIKKTSSLSLSDFLLRLETTTEPQLELIDTEACQIEMVILLSQQYTNFKTVARLSSNIIKLYRELERKKKLTCISDNDNLIILKKEANEVGTSVPVNLKVDSSESLEVKLKSKKKLASTLFSLFSLILGTAASYYLWQVEATETDLSGSVAGQASQNYKTFEDRRVMAIMGQERIKIEKIQLFEQQKLKKQLDNVLKQQKEEELKEKAEKQRLIQKDKLVSERENQELTAQKEKRLRAEAKEKVLKKERQVEAEVQEKEKGLERTQREKNSFLSIERDIELITRHDEKIHAQYTIKQQEAKIATEKREEKTGLDALVKQRREEFEKNKVQQKHPTMQVLVVKSVIPKSRKQQQLQVQRHIRGRANKKKQQILIELKKQQLKQIRAKDERAQLKQKTTVHQLVNYSKTFNSHTVQLKQKLEAIAFLDQRPEAFSNPKIVHGRTLLQGKEATIRKRLDSLAKLYSAKIKRLCRETKIYPVIPSASNQVERIARSVIAQQLRHCSRPQFLSTKAVTTALLNKYLK